MLPLWIKVSYTVFALLTAAIYARKWGWGNFLWFSDVALLLTVPALWTESRLLFSMLAVGATLPELFWNIGFFTRLLTGRRLSPLTDYMFDAAKPLWLRALSFFHIFLPVLLLWSVARLGYAPQALWYQTALAWVVLILSYACTDPAENVNSVYGPGKKPQTWMHPLAYLGLLLLFFLLVIYLPTHFVLKWWLT